MSSPSSTHDPDDMILAAFVAELEKRGSAAIEEYVQRYPHLAGQIQDLIGAGDVIDDTREASDDSVPERLGDFRIVRPLARGGMGEIYEAVQEHLGRRVAVKLIRRGRASEQARERFEREQKVLARLHQTHIIPIHVAGEEGRLQYFVMPYIEGAALHHVVQAARQFEPIRAGGSTPTLAAIAGQVAKQRKDTAEVWRQVSNLPLVPGKLETCRHTESFLKEPLTGSEEVVAAPAAPRPLRLSRAYFRSVAEVMADAAEAVEHVHGVGILHRDLKPSNIMVGTKGECWIIDFGLATYPDDADKPEPAGETRDSNLLTVPGAVAGTPEYLAPERLDGQADIRSDVWGLGATLYELLTLRQAFKAPSFEELCAAIRDHEPTPPRSQIADIPRDLEAICRKALRKAPGQRYRTAGAFAEDLRRWLRLEPTTARPARAPRRVWLWSLRNPGWAIALVMTLLAGLGLGTGGILWQMAERRAAEQRERESRRQNLLLELQQLRTTLHTNGWRDKAWNFVREIVEMRKDSVVQSQAAATLAGLDAKLEKEFTFDASSVVFDGSGEWLAIGGYTNFEGKAAEPARVWDGGIDVPRKSTRLGSGPVAFRATDHAPLQLTPEPDDWFTLTLWNIDKQQSVGKFKLADKPPPRGWHISNRLTLALSATGSLVAASTTLADGKATLLVWDVKSGKQVHKVEKVCTALAFSPNAALLAGGDEEGAVTVWSLGKLDAKPTTLPVGRTAILSLAFTEDRRRRTNREPEGGNWLLAAGEAGSDVTIWELQTKQLKTYCRGSSHAVHSLAFSPDGTILASAGRNPAKLWDAATGQLLLDGHKYGRNWMTGVAFSPDGKRLAISFRSIFDLRGGVDVWELEHGRGIRTLRGLAHRVAQVKVSPDDRFLAALTDAWQVGIWNLDSGRLLHVLDVPPGYFSDNASLAFSANGDRFAFSTKTAAKLWDVKTGKQIDSWELPPGLGDKMAFDPTGRRLLLVRVETKGNQPPLASIPFDQFPRVVRAYDLLSQKRTPKAFANIPDFKFDAFVHAIAPDASWFFVEGFPDAMERRDRTLTTRDGTTGKELSSVRVRVYSKEAHTTVIVDPTGKLLALNLSTRSEGTFQLLEMPSGRLLKPLNRLGVLSAGGKLWATGPAVSIYRDLEEQPLVTFDSEDGFAAAALFTPKASQFAIGNRDGTVSVYGLETIQRELAAFRLGW